MKAVYKFTITKEHIAAKAPFQIVEPTELTTIVNQAAVARSLLGQLLPIDEGKRVYRVGKTNQVENNEQRDSRNHTNHNQKVMTP